MEVKIPDKPDPQSNLIEFKRGKRTGTLVPVRKAYDSCKHQKIFVDEGKREVTCQDCKALMDPFGVLLELAWKQRRWLEELDEWDARRDSLLSERYDREWERDQLEVKQPPPTDTEARQAWETFREYFKGKFVSMYKRKRRLRTGPEWYGRSTCGGVVSFEYARSQMIARAVAADVR